MPKIPEGETMTVRTRLFIRFILIVSLVASSLPEMPPGGLTRPLYPLSCFQRQALAAPALSDIHDAARRGAAVCINTIKLFHELSFGERSMAAYRRPWRKSLWLLQTFLLVDTVLILLIPLAGQTLYDTALHGAGMVGSMPRMIGLSAFSLGVVSLPRFRGWVQSRLERLLAAYAADLQGPAFDHWLRTVDSRFPPRGLGAQIAQALAGSAQKNVGIPARFRTAALFLACSGVMLWRLNPVMAGIVGAAIVGLWFWTVHGSAPLEKELAESNAAKAAAMAKLEAVFAPSQLKNIQAQGLEGRMSQAIAEFLNPVRAQELRLTTRKRRTQDWQTMISDLLLMTGLTLWGVWGVYWSGTPLSGFWLLLYRHGTPTLGQLLALQAFAWNVQHSFSTLMGLVRSRADAHATAPILSGIQGLLQEPQSKDVPAGDLVCEGVSYQNADGMWVMQDFNITLKEGETLTIRGESGVGKTLMLRLLSGLVAPTQGKIRIGGVPPRNAQRALAFVPQAYDSALQSDLSVDKNFLQLVPNASEASVREALEKAGADFLFSERYPRGTETRVEELSGGQRRRLDLAIALLRHPKILFLDEPTAGLDPENRAVMESRLRALHAEGVTLVVVTHDDLELGGKTIRLNRIKDPTPAVHTPLALKPLILKTIGLLLVIGSTLARLI